MPKKSIAKFIRRRGETLAYLFFWVMVYTTPVLMMYLRTQNHTDLEFEWDEIYHLWFLASVFFVLFIVHNFFLAPCSFTRTVGVFISLLSPLSLLSMPYFNSPCVLLDHDISIITFEQR